MYFKASDANPQVSHIQDFNITQSFKLDASGNVTIQQVIDIFTYFARNVALWPTHKLEYDVVTRQLHRQSVNNTLFHTVPKVQQKLLQFSDVGNSRL